MKQTCRNNLVLGIIILANGSLLADCINNVSPTFVIRSQAFDKARRVVGVEEFTHLYGIDDFYGEFSVIPGYEQSFKPNRIVRTLFGNDLQGPDCNTIKIQGSMIATRDPKAWLADYFYLPASYDGTISFKPTIKTIFADMDFYLGLDNFWCGGYVRISAPVVNSRWNLNFCESHTTGTEGFVAGYFTPNDIPADQLLQSFGSYAAGNAPGNGTVFQTATGLDAAGAPTTRIFATSFDPLNFARISQERRSKTGFGELRFEIGNNFHLLEYSVAGINIQVAAPTGTKRKARYAFDPVVGNGHHWELGFGGVAHHTFWLCEDKTRSFGIWGDFTFSHIFKGREQRTFDLCGKPNSRYMLAARFTPVNTELLNGTNMALTTTPGIFPSAIFANEYAPVANLTTLDVQVRSALQADIVIWFNYTHCNWSFDLGYNLWARTCEKFTCPDSCHARCNCPSICDEGQQNTWALKGDAREFGFLSVSNAAVQLSASESLADIHNGTNATQPADPNDPFYKRNFGVDNALFAQLGNTNPTEPVLFARDLVATTSTQIKTSVDPIFITCNDIDLRPTRGISNKVFAHVNYDWECECYTPFFGIGGFAEFGITESNKDNNNCTTNNLCSSNSCRDCVDSALTQWGVWVKLGVGY